MLGASVLGAVLPAACLPGCGPVAAPVDVGPGADASAPCSEPDRACTEEPPLPGSPCEGMLSCPFPPGGVATCAGGVWSFDPGCDGGCAPPLAELCRSPFAGTLGRSRVELGPVDGPFRPFSAHEIIAATFGGQGGAMLAYRVRIDGADVPACMTVDAVVTYDGMTPVPSHRAVELHCGQTLGVFEILPGSPCEARVYPITLDVEVAGAGTATATLDLMGGLCPRTF